MRERKWEVSENERKMREEMRIGETMKKEKTEWERKRREWERENEEERSGYLTVQS
jgi:hypothetical protein